MYITAQGLRLHNDLYCVEWDVKLYYTIPYLVLPSVYSRDVIRLISWADMARCSLFVLKMPVNTHHPHVLAHPGWLSRRKDTDSAS